MEKDDRPPENETLLVGTREIRDFKDGECEGSDGEKNDVLKSEVLVLYCDSEIDGDDALSEVAAIVGGCSCSELRVLSERNREKE